MGAILELIATIVFDLIVGYRITRWIAGLALMAGTVLWGGLEGMMSWVVMLGILAFLLTIDNLERWGAVPQSRRRPRQ